MADIQDHDSLSFGDALFLYLEREGMPLNVASLSLFEGAIPREACIDFVRSKLALIPRYRQHVVVPPFNLGLPMWEFDRNFDLRNHIRELTLKHGTEAELRKITAQVLSTTMDRSRPLWDLTLLHGMKGNRTGLLTRVHHCMADGISGVGLMNVLMDPSPHVSAPPAKKARLPLPAAGQGTDSLVDGFVRSCFSAVQQVLTAQSELLNMAQHVVAAAGKQPEQAPQGQPGFNSEAYLPSLAELSRLLPEFAAVPERLPFNVICRGPQKFNWAEISLDEIKAVKHACGVTVNDVVLALVTATVRRYAELHRVPLQGRLLRIVVPVSVRGKGNMTEMGNRITFVPLSIPLDIRDPRKLIAAVRERMGFLKSTHVAEFVGLAGTLIGTIPTTLQALVGPIASQLPLSVCNLICTNVPGPKIPLYLLGHKMLSCYPYVPIGGEMGMNCALLTYNGTAFFGFTGDANAIPDLHHLEKFLKISFTELRQATGVRARRPSRQTQRRKAKVAPAAVAVAERQSAPEVISFPANPAASSEPKETARPRAVKEGNTKAFRAAIGA